MKNNRSPPLPPPRISRRPSPPGGAFPLTLVTGAGAVARNSIGIVLVGGMSIGTMFTLFIVPSVYVLIAKDHTADRHATERAADPHAAAAAAE
ncbi:MAG TPA: efflux RND transporter permease subunit [Minicystis sp.]|nr:efflux RND transporter permease subunit [Minicystis sp.]